MGTRTNGTGRRAGLALVTAGLALGLSAGCASSGDSTPVGRDRSLNVGQGGAQDIAYFRSIVAGGGVPSPETLDPVGFFAEHALDLPPADCGDSVCVHASLAVAPRFDGGNWTMGYVAMNSALDPATLPRPAVHLVLAVDTSASTADLRAGLVDAAREMLAPLRPEDRVSIVRVGVTADLLVDSAIPTDRAIGTAITTLATASDDGVALYDGLAVAGQAALERPTADALAHVTLLSSGAASRGITGQDRIVELAEQLAGEGVSLSVVGGGSAFDDRIPIAIGEIGTGAYYFATDGADLREILGLEGRTRLLPIATAFSVRVVPSAGYRVGRVYGARRMTATDTEARLDTPVLLLGQREGAMDVDRGRRGGGGGLFIELIADPESGVAENMPAFVVEATYLDAISGETVTQRITTSNPLRPGANPPTMMAEFSDPTPARAKAYMMLNMFLALRAATELYDAADCARAVGVIDMMSRSVELWQATEYGDPDIAADWDLMLDLQDNIETQCEATFGPVTPVEPRTFPGGCMLS
jgi:Ca-activated chloride channel family protein